MSKKLIVDHKTYLDKMKINYHDSKFKTTVDMFALFKNQQKIEELSDNIKSQLSFYQTYFRLTLIAFLMFAVLGILTVIMTWN